MSGKSDWEKRVGTLLDPERHQEFVWSYKAPDSAFYGGQPRIDWVACDILGRLWMIEVKLLPLDRKSLNLLNDVTPGQRDALGGVARSAQGIPLLAVGHDTTLYLFHWRDILWSHAPLDQNPRLPLEASFHSFEWSGPKKWLHRLFTLINDQLPALVPPLMPPAGLLSDTASSASISKHADSIRTPRLMRRLEP